MGNAHYSRRWPKLSLLLSLTVSFQLLAQTAPEVGVDLSAKRVIFNEGNESLVSAEKAKPGDTIQYDAVYKNSGNAPVTNVVATVPIPAGLALTADSAKPVAEQASLDGKNFGAVPLMREVKNAAGLAEKQPVPLAQYRALRWLLPELPPGHSATVSLRAKVLTNSPTE